MLDKIKYKIGDKVRPCECGCGVWIIYKKHHKYYGIPRFISDHDKKLPHKNGMLGKHHSEETKKKFSIQGRKNYLLGRWKPPLKNKTWEESYGIEKSQKLKRDASIRAKKRFKGFPKSEEHLRKIRARLSIFNRSEKQRLTISKAQTGRKDSLERIEQKRIEALTNMNIRKGWFKKGEPSRGVPFIKGQFSGENNPAKRPEVREKLRKFRETFVTPKKDTSIEVKIQGFLKQLNIGFLKHKFIKEIKHSYQCDIFIPSMNLVIECDGNYWHKYPVGKELDATRTKELIEKGFKVLRLWESEINSMYLEEFLILLYLENKPVPEPITTMLKNLVEK